MPTRSYEAPSPDALPPTVPAPAPPISASDNRFRKPSTRAGFPEETKEQKAARHKARFRAAAHEAHYNAELECRHSAYLRARMRHIYPEVVRLQKEDNDAYDAGTLQPRRTRLADALNPDAGVELVPPSERGYIGLMQPPETPGENKFIHYDRLCDAQEQDNYDALVSGGSDQNGLGLLFKSNRETAWWVHVYRHMDQILAPVPFRVGDVVLTPEQRLSIGALGSACSSRSTLRARRQARSRATSPSASACRQA